jgi:hypothetical protein
VDAGLSHGKKAKSSLKGAFGVVVKNKRRDGSESLRNGERARRDGSKEETRESLSFFF